MESWFSDKIIKWYLTNKRDLPWRHTQDAYRIWLSEIILQQTQVVQGMAYYYRFIEKYPEVKQLAAAPEDEVLKLWQGLGYYSRARNLRQAAQNIVQNHQGVFPLEYDNIRALKGVGDYTAAAISSFAFNQPYAVVDGNVYRLLSRLFGITTPIDSGKGKKEFTELANSLLNKKQPGLHNQAIMEFGSQYCKPLNPDCGNCIFKSKCLAFTNGLVKTLPVKTKKTKVRKRYFNYLVIGDGNGSVYVKRRNQKDIWQGLYEFMLVETEKAVSPSKLFAGSLVKSTFKKKFDVKFSSKMYKHVLSHQTLMARFFLIEAKSVSTAQGLVKINHTKLTSLGFPRLIEKFISSCDLKEII